MHPSHAVDEMRWACQAHVSFVEVRKRRLRPSVRRSRPPAFAQMQDCFSLLPPLVKAMKMMITTNVNALLCLLISTLDVVATAADVLC